MVLPAAAQTINEDLKLTASDAAAADEFGVAVAISGTIAIVGSWQDDQVGTNSGSAYLFDTATGNQLFKLTASDGAAGDEFGRSVAVSGTTAIVGANGDGSFTGSAYLFNTQTGVQIAKLTASDAAVNDRFGYAVAISGTTAIVGALGNDDNGSSSGSAYLFDTITGNQLAKLTASDAAAADFFGWSVAISGTTAIIGAWGDDDAGSSSGSAYIFNTVTGNQIAKLTASDAGAGDSFGFSVAISGDTAIVGSYLDDDSGADSGSAYLFNTATGNQFAKFTATDAASGDLFGYAVGFSGSTAIVGAYGNQDTSAFSGSAYLFDTLTGARLAKVTASDAAGGDAFGISVAIAGTTAIVGARLDDDAGADSGSAYLIAVPARSQSINEEIKIVASDAAPEDFFGNSVAISGTTAIAGAFGNDDAGTFSGSAYLFDTVTGNQLFKLTASDAAAFDQFGLSVAIAGTTAIIGARGDDDAGTDSGSAYVFDTTTGQQRFKLTASDAAEFDYFGDSVAISGSTAIIGAPFNEDAGSSSGSAYLFDTVTGNQLAKLTASDAAAFDQFGVSVAISGTTAIIGASRDDGVGSDSGSAYLFNTVTGLQIAKLTASDAAAFEFFGSSVAISGTTAIVGALRIDAAGPYAGSAYLFDTVTGNQITKLTGPDAAAADFFGISLAISDTMAIVGASVPSRGSAYIFDTTTGLQLFKLTASDGVPGDILGTSVGISGGAAIVGASRNDDGAGFRSGSAYIFNLETCTADLSGDGMLNFFDVSAFLSAYSGGDLLADFNGDGVLNFFDVSAFLNAFNAGCP